MAAILAGDSFKYIFLNENELMSIQISLKFVPIVPIDNKSALVQVMAWRRTGDKPLSEAMMTQFTDAYMRHQGEMSFKKILSLSYRMLYFRIVEWRMENLHNGVEPKEKVLEQESRFLYTNWSSTSLALCDENHRWPMDSPRKGPLMRNFHICYVVNWTSCWTNNRVAGYLMRLNGHITSY